MMLIKNKRVHKQMMDTANQNNQDFHIEMNDIIRDQFDKFTSTPTFAHNGTAYAVSVVRTQLFDVTSETDIRGITGLNVFHSAWKHTEMGILVRGVNL